MTLFRKMTLLIGKNVLGFLAVALLIILIAFLPLGVMIHRNSMTNDQIFTSWPVYWSAVLTYIKDLLHGDLGELTTRLKWLDSSVDILKTVFSYSWRSCQILLPALVVAAAAGLLAGGGTCFLSRRVRKWIGSLNQLLFSLPDLLVVLLLQMLIIRFDKWYGSYLIAIADYGGKQAMLGPILCVAFPVAVYVFRYTVNACEEALAMEYVRTARAKGLPARIVFFKHVMRPALDTVLAALPKLVAFAVSGMIIVERLFNIRGITWFFGTSLQNPQMAKMLATLLLMLAAFVIVINILTSALRLWVNPALRK